MVDVPVLHPSHRAALITRALGAAWPLQALVVALWLLVPHCADAREPWVIALTLAAAPLHLPLLRRRPPTLTRLALNVSAVLGIAQMCGLVWAGGGLTSGFPLMSLWFLPVVVCALPRRDVAAHVVLVLAGCAPRPRTSSAAASRTR
jgi:hypothetical protein